MFKKMSSRNQRLKGIRMKHVLQICLLLGVCFWLIYQVKHSHDKRKEFDEKDASVSMKERTDDLVKFGMKDLPSVQEASKNYKHEEEEEEEENAIEDENKHDEDMEEKPKRADEGASKHEEEEEPEEVRGDEGGNRDDEEQEAEVKDEEAEDEGKGDGDGDGDDEVNENERETADAEVGNEEELVDDEKEREADGDEKENEEKKGQEESEHSANEAREVHYKADDASSAVSHDTQIVSSEADSLETGNSSDNLTRNVLEQESKANSTEKAEAKDEGERSESDNSLNETYAKENDHEIGSSNSEHISLPNTTNTTDFVDQASNNSTEVSKETGKMDSKVNSEMPGSLQNGTSAQGATEDGMVTEEKYEERGNETTSNGQQSGSNTVDASTIEMVDLITTESGLSDETTRITASAEGHDSESSTTKENTDSTQDEKQGEGESRGADESSDISTSNDPIDSTDNSLSREEKDAAVDLSTLPDITTEGSNNEDTVAE